MRRVVPWFVVLGGALALGGCSDEPPPSTPGPVVPGTGGGGGEGGDGVGGGGGGVVIPDTPCEDPAQTLVEVSPPGSYFQLTRLIRSERRFHASGFLGHVSFDVNGANADPMPVQTGSNFNVIADEGLHLGVAASSASWTGYRRYNYQGSAMGAPRTLSFAGADGITLGSVNGSSLILWGDNGKLVGRTVTAAGTIGPPAFDVQPGAYSSGLRLTAVSATNAVGLAWTGSPELGRHESWFMLVDDAGPLGEKTPIFDSPAPHVLEQVVAIDQGFVALLTGPAPELAPSLVFLDESGAVVGSTKTLEGAALAYGLAANNGTLAIVAGRTTGEPQIRVFDLDLEPLGPWVCLAAEHNNATKPAISADADGFAVILETTEGAMHLARVDALGTGAP